MSFIDYISGHLGEPKWNSSEIEAQWCCPFCTERGEGQDTKYRFRFNKYKLLGVCYNCGWGGNAISFVRDLQKLTWGDAYDIVNFYMDFQPLPQDVYEEVFDKLYLEGVEIDIKKKYIPLPSDFKLLAGSTSLMADTYLKYAKQRKLTDKQIALHGVGFCPEGEVILPNSKKTYLSNRLFIQVFDEDKKPLYWMARALKSDMKPKTFNPVGGTNTINKTDVIFNLNNAKRTGVAVINEGVFDATTVGNSGVALFGKTLNVKQLLNIIKGGFEAVYIMLDPDAFSYAIKMAELISRHIENTYLCNLKGGDPNEVGRKGCLEAIKDAEKFDKLTALKMRLLN